MLNFKSVWTFLMIRDLFFFIFTFDMFINMIQMIDVKLKLQMIDAKLNNTRIKFFFDVILICMWYFKKNNITSILSLLRSWH
jgi:hypothetical protein